MAAWTPIAEILPVPERLRNDLRMILEEFPLKSHARQYRLCDTTDEKNIYAIEVEYADGRIRRFNDFHYGVYPVDATQAEFKALFHYIARMQERTGTDVGSTHLEAFREMAAAQRVIEDAKAAETLDEKLVESVRRLVDTLEKTIAVYEKHATVPPAARAQRLKKRAEGIGVRCKKIKYDGDAVAYKDTQMEYVNALELYLAELRREL